MKKSKEAYEELLPLLEKYKDDVVFDVNHLLRQAEHHLFGIKLVDEYGFKLDPKVIVSTDWQRLIPNVCIGLFDGKVRSISWSDDGVQPENEHLLYISFPTGAYIFGEDYSKDLFQEFWLELKSFEPKYSDTANKGLYFTLENAGKIYNAYPSVYKKFKEVYDSNAKLRNIQRLKDELSKLEE